MVNSINFIANLQYQLDQLPWATYFNKVIQKSGVEIAAMPDSYIQEHPDSPALLALREKPPKVFLRDFATPSELSHELRHADQYFNFPKELIAAKDLKHRYIFMAFAEADAMVHEIFVYIQNLNVDPEFLAMEQEKFDLYQNSGNYGDLKPIETALFVGLGLSPETLADKSFDTDQDYLYLIGYQIFQWILLEFLKEDYEAGHLKQIRISIEKSDSEHSTSKRSAPMNEVTQEDLNFFTECLYEFGAPADLLNDCYLIAPNGHGLNPNYFLKALFPERVCSELETLNQSINSRDDEPTPNGLE